MSAKPLLPAEPAEQLAKETENAAANLFARFGRDALHVALQNRQRARITGRLTDACAWRSIQMSIAELIEREADRAYSTRLPARTALKDFARRLAPPATDATRDLATR